MRKFAFMLIGLCLFVAQSMAQSMKINGKITDAKDGTPLSGVSVTSREGKNGAKTDVNGNYSITVSGGKQVLIFSYVGFLREERTVGNLQNVNVSLTADNKQLDEVVVVGYGVQKKVNLASAQTRVGGERLEDVPLASADQILQGKVPGLQSSSSSGQPGANQDIRIRGVGSVTASSQPLYVIDGIQIVSGNLSRNTTSTNVLAGLNPNDIDNITVLKDAGATAIYGSRGSNGVIVITTKRGKAGKTQFRFDSELGQNSFANVPDAGRPLNATDWLTLGKEGYVNAGYTQAQANTLAKNYGDSSGINTDWFNLVTRKALQQQYTLSASGGDAKTTYYVSVGFFNQDAAVLGSNLKRYSTSFNLKNIASKAVTFNFGFTGAYQNQNSPFQGGSFSNPVLGIWFLRPTQNAFNTDGSYNISRVGNTNFPNIPNPLYIINKNIYNDKQVQARPNLTTEITLLPGLKYTNKSSIDYNSLEEFQYWNPNMGDGVTYGGYGFTYYTRYFLYDEINQLDYHLNLNKDKSFYIDAKAGYEAISSNQFTINATTNNYSTDKLTAQANAATPVSASNDTYEYTYANIFSSGVVNYKDRYILTGSFRRDGSSRFGEQVKYANFPSVGASWNVSKEKFFDNISTISFLKLRASLGSTGNSEIGNYTSIPTQGSNYNYNSQPGTAFNNVGNSSLTWEKTTQFDIGVDMGLFKNRLNIVFDYYNRETDNILFALPLSASTGFGSGQSAVSGGQNFNLGNMRNRGYEIALDGTPVLTRNFTWNVSFNISHNTNKVLALYQGKDVTNPNNAAQNIRVGYDVQTFYARIYAGVDPATGNPLWYTDGTKSGTTTNYSTGAVRVMDGSASPKYFGGFTNTFTYKAFSLSADIYYNYGNYVRDSWASYLSDGQYAFNYGKYANNMQRWQNPGDITNIPKYVYGSTNSSNGFSTRFLYKGDYIRLRNVTLGYMMPSALATKMHLSSIRFYVRGTNLLTKTYDKNLTIDPEQGAYGNSNLNVFLPKSTTVGLNIGF